MNRLRERILESPAIRGSLFYGAYWSVFALYMPFMNLELTRRGFSGVEVGSIGSIRGFIIMLAAPIFSRLADRLGIRVKMLRVFMMLSAVGVTLLMFPQSFGWLIAAAVFLSVMQSPIDPLSNSITVRMARRYHLDFGKMTFWGAFAFATMNLIGGAVWERFGFRWIYLCAGVMYVIVSLIAANLEEPVEVDEVGEPVLTKLQAPGKFHLPPAVLFFFMAHFGANFAYFCAFGFTAPILDMRGANEFVIGLVGTVIGVGGMLIRRNSQRIIDRFSPETAMIMGILAGLIPIFVYGWVDNVALMVIFSVFRGAGWGLFQVCAVRYLDEQGSVQNASTLQGILVMLSTLAGIIASTLSGYLFDTNLVMIFVISAGMIFFSLACLLVVKYLNHKTQLAEYIEHTPEVNLPA
jgi:MFS transporter, PPP family, 3-phenylpropionic acid transporter